VRLRSLQCSGVQCSSVAASSWRLLCQWRVACSLPQSRLKQHTVRANALVAVAVVSTSVHISAAAQHCTSTCCCQIEGAEAEARSAIAAAAARYEDKVHTLSKERDKYKQEAALQQARRKEAAEGGRSAASRLAEAERYAMYSHTCTHTLHRTTQRSSSRSSSAQLSLMSIYTAAAAVMVTV
jgi:DNA topoisomerase VI subunit B